MASRQEQKERARSQRVALEREQATAAQRRRRIQILAGAAVVAIIVVVVAIIATSGGSSSGVQSGSKANKTVAAVTSELKGIRQGGSVLGPPNAPVTMRYFGDLQCPVCRDFTVQTIPRVIQTYVRAGKLKIDYRNLETATGDPATFRKQQVAALAAGQQNRAWQYIELFYRQQGPEGTGYVNQRFLESIAKQVPGLNFSRWKAALSDPALANQVRADATAAGIIGANSTPTLVFKGPKGTQQIVGMALMSDITRAYAAVA